MRTIQIHECECHPKTNYLGFVRVLKLSDVESLQMPLLVRTCVVCARPNNGMHHHGYGFTLFSFLFIVTLTKGYEA